MDIQFWGVRGSIPTPGPTTLHYGGNTSCVSVRWGADKVIVLDAGTGIRILGNHILAEPSAIFLLVTHTHWDHVQGFPFFAPIYQPDREIHVFPTQQGKSALCAAIEQMDGAHFPITPDQLPSRWQCITEDEPAFLHQHAIDLSRIKLNHPGGGYGFRLEHGGHSVAYIPDNELHPPGNRTTTFEEFAAFCHGVDVLIHDAQYTKEDMPAKQGWGHSQVDHALHLGVAAQVKQLVLFHHAPERSDNELDELGKSVECSLRGVSCGPKCVFAREGLSIEV